MCLNLKGKKAINYRLLGKPNSKGLYSGYKVFIRFGKGFDRLESDHTSIYCSYDWQQGWNISSRLFRDLTPNEKRFGNVQVGFHIFLHKTDALKLRSNINNIDRSYICRKVYFKLDDVVATGTWDSGEELCAVVRKLLARFD